MTTGAAALAGDNAPAPAGDPPAGDPPAPAPAPAPAGDPPAGDPPAPAGEAALWYKDLPTEAHAKIATKGWQSPADMFQSYENIEKVMGLPADVKADAILVRPKDGAPASEVQAFVDKAVSHLVPATPEDYGDMGVKLEAGETLPPELEQARGWMHEAKIPSTQAPALVAAYQKSVEQAEAAFQAQSTKDMADLTTEFGDKADDSFELGRRAFAAAKEQAGLTPEGLAAIERAIGTKAMMKLFIAQGRNLVEAPGGGAPNNEGSKTSGFRTTPEAAKAKVQEKFNDSEFMARYNSPNQAVRKVAIEEMEALQKIVAGTPDA